MIYKKVMAKSKRTFRQKLQLFLFWFVAFLWLMYGTLIFLAIGITSDFDRRHYQQRMQTTKDTRDDAFKHPDNVGADFDRRYAGQGGMQEMLAIGDLHIDMDQAPADRNRWGPISWLWGSG